MKPGEPYAYRRYPNRYPDADNAPVRVECVAPAPPRKYRVRFEDGHEEDVMPNTLLAPWDRIGAILDCEAAQRALDEETPANDVIGFAIGIVLGATGERTVSADSKTAFGDSIDLQRIMRRAGLDGTPLDQSPLAFKNWRDDTVYLPLDAGERLARAFLASEPDQVRLEVERELYTRPRNIEFRQALAMVQRWLGDLPRSESDQLRADVAELRAEVERLRGLIEGAA